MGLVLVTPGSATGVVSVVEAKRFCGIEDASFDALIEELIAAAVSWAEAFTGRALAEQTWRLYLDGFTDEIELPLGPDRDTEATSVLAVASVKYDDEDGVERTLAGTVYALDLTSDPQLVVLLDDQSWPDIADTPNPVRIEYTTGFGTIPAALELAVKQIVAGWFEDRTAPPPAGALASLRPWRRMAL